MLDVNSVDDECKVWVMKEFGVAELWVKCHAFSKFSGDIYHTMSGRSARHVTRGSDRSSRSKRDGRGNNIGKEGVILEIFVVE